MIFWLLWKPNWQQILTLVSSVLEVGGQFLRRRQWISWQRLVPLPCALELHSAASGPSTSPAMVPRMSAKDIRSVL